jgi:hypothetical protein
VICSIGILITNLTKIEGINQKSSLYLCAQLNETNSLDSSSQIMENEYDLKFGVERTNLLYHRGALDDIGIWNRALTQAEITALYNSAEPCEVSITTQPVDSQVAPGQNAQFSVTATGQNLAYQWQSDIGFGFQNLTIVKIMANLVLLPLVA